MYKICCLKSHLVQTGSEIRRLVSKIPVRRTRKRCQKILHSVQNDRFLIVSCHFEAGLTCRRIFLISLFKRCFGKTLLHLDLLVQMDV